MDEQKEIQRYEQGVDTKDQPVAGEPYIEELNEELNSRQPAQNKPSTNTSSNNLSQGLSQGLMPLFAETATEKFRARWLAIQSKFVDDPNDAVKQADSLVVDVIQGITDSFANRRSSLEKEWSGGGDASTEDLRLALKQYRSFFDRLLTLES